MFPFRLLRLDSSPTMDDEGLRSVMSAPDVGLAA